MKTQQLTNKPKKSHTHTRARARAEPFFCRNVTGHDTIYIKLFLYKQPIPLTSIIVADEVKEANYCTPVEAVGCEDR